MVTRVQTGLQEFTWSNEGIRGFPLVKRVTLGYKGLPRVTGDYKGLQGFLRKKIGNRIMT